MSEEPVWVTTEQATEIALRSVKRFGGLSGKVRDENSLGAAIERPRQKWIYQEPDYFALAAAYCFSITKGHPFHDGNKRTAYVVAVTFLELNGFVCLPNQSDIIETMLGAADGSVTEKQLADWFRNNSRSS